MAHHPNGLLLVNFVLNCAATCLEPRQDEVRRTLHLPGSLNRKHGGLVHVSTPRESG
jgi:hypothetical protein